MMAASAAATSVIVTTNEPNVIRRVIRQSAVNSRQLRIQSTVNSQKLQPATHLVRDKPKGDN